MSREPVQDSIELKRNIYDLLREGEFEGAEELTLKGMEDDLNNADYEELLKTIKFWQNRKDLFVYRDSAGEKLYGEWDRFQDFCRKNSIDNKKSVLAVKDFVFRKIVDFLIDSYRISPVPERDTLVLLGQSFAELGLTDKAVETLEYALSLTADDQDVRIFLLLGNLYVQADAKDLAMVMYNEAFFKFPQLVRLDAIEYPPIQKLRQIAAEDGFAPNEVQEWVPVYGYLYDALTARRKMEYKDYMDLKERITDYEKSLKVDKKAAGIIVPRLVNFYLWILDYYVYGVKAFSPAENVMRRVLELIRGVPAGEKTREKILLRADGLFRKMLKNRQPFGSPAR